MDEFSESETDWGSGASGDMDPGLKKDEVSGPGSDWDPGGEPEGKGPELETNEVPLSDTEWESAAPENIDLNQKPINSTLNRRNSKTSHMTGG